MTPPPTTDDAGTKKMVDAWGGGEDWENQADDSPLVKLGDGEGQVAEARGLLTRISTDQFGNPMYHLQQQDGTGIRLCSNTTMVQQLPADALGELVIAKFVGWVTPKKGGKPFKGIEVTIFKGNTLPTPLAEAFPRWRKINKTAAVAAAKKAQGPSFADVGTQPESGVPGDPKPEDDDLPF